MNVCRICDGPAGATYRVPDVMYGTGEAYPYFQCTACDCLQIQDVPGDLARHYPPAYYSFAPPRIRRASLRRRLVDRWAYERRGGPLGRFLHSRHPNPELGLLRDLGVSRGDPILDVGCGNGQRVVDLRRAGFTAAEGLDAFLPADVVVDGYVVARRTSLEEVTGRFRLVMFHHVLEHLPDPHAALRAARERLHPAGAVLVRVPTVSSFAWEEYREHWVQIDAPRHLYLHSARSLEVLARRAGFSVSRVEHDSTGFQFWGSEQVRRGIPLVRAGAGRWDAGIFSAREHARFERRARLLNAAGRGDQVAVVLAPEWPTSPLSRGTGPS